MAGLCTSCEIDELLALLGDGWSARKKTYNLVAQGKHCAQCKVFREMLLYYDREIRHKGRRDLIPAAIWVADQLEKRDGGRFLRWLMFDAMVQEATSIPKDWTATTYSDSFRHRGTTAARLPDFKVIDWMAQPE